MSHTVLVANRGEIALRVFRTARRMGMRCVAVYSDADAGAPFVRAADAAVRIGPAPASESYLRSDRILEAATQTGADLIHPGYGFLAEDPSFARDCEDLGFTFVGPPPAVLAAVGDKAQARRIAARAGVPVLAGYDGEDQSDDALVAAAEEIGYPLVVKPAAGGGGKGMAVVRGRDELVAALASARRVAKAAFGDDRLILERYLAGPRHVEVQVLADAYGNVIHLGERDCSLQRRHQKVMEEAPSPAVDAALRERLCEAAVRLARAVGYRNAGTCEFLVGEDGSFGFIEVNARLQVEHPVTEEVYGIDLVEAQLRLALGERLWISPQDVRPRGHAIEVRVYAEDPEQGYLPQSGRILHVAWPASARVECGIEEGSIVTPHYDPMLAKVVVWGEDRVAALWALHRALPRCQVLGVRTNLPLLKAVCQDSVVLDGKVTTTFLEEAYARWRSGSDHPNALAVAVAAAAEASRRLEEGRASPDPWSRLGPWRAGGGGRIPVTLRIGDEERTEWVEGTGPFAVGRLRAGRAPGCHAWWVIHQGSPPAAAAYEDGAWHVWLEEPYVFAVGPRERRASEGGPSHLGAPLPGQVIAVRVEPGEAVTAGQELVVVEAMKMEHALKAPADGVVRAVLCAVGDQVERGQTLVDFEPAAG